MDSILQLTVYLANIDDYDGMNKIFKTYFPNGGPARTTVAVAAFRETPWSRSIALRPLF